MSQTAKFDYSARNNGRNRSRKIEDCVRHVANEPMETNVCYSGTMETTIYTLNSADKVMLQPSLWQGYKQFAAFCSEADLDPTTDNDIIAMPTSFASDNESDQEEVEIPSPPLWQQAWQPITTVPTNTTRKAKEV
jgi:hypothetical protein